MKFWVSTLFKEDLYYKNCSQKSHAEGTNIHCAIPEAGLSSIIELLCLDPHFLCVEATILVEELYFLMSDLPPADKWSDDW